jgi:predicted acylesterase/phospholipase RssA
MIASNENASLPPEPPRRFQVLALSGGGYRGLYTAKVIADLEEALGAPIATRFDLIAGTSVGGILALALAREVPAARIVELFVKHGEEIFAKRWSFFGVVRAPYSATSLHRLLVAEDLFGRALLGACKHPVIIPAINFSTGQLVAFKTPHHSKLVRDHKMPLVDVALATSAAPGFFPRHVFENSQYVDGGLVANAPGMMALHEGTQYFGCQDKDIHLMSVGTMSARSTVNPRRNARGGLYDWGDGNILQAPRKLFGLSISVQESLSCSMIEHRLGSRYLHIDDENSDARARAVGLDITDAAAKQVLLGTAEQRSKKCAGDSRVQEFLKHIAPIATFFHAGGDARVTHA